MCSSKSKLQRSVDAPAVAQINGRPVLQPTCNRVPSLERRLSLKKAAPKSPPPPPAPITTPASVTNYTRTRISLTPPISPKSKSPRPVTVKRGGNELNGLNSSTEKMVTPRSAAKPSSSTKKSKNATCGAGQSMDYSALSYESSLILEAPGSIAATRREQVAIMQEQRKMKIAHYGRTKSAKYEGKVVPLDSSATAAKEEKRCSFITPNSGIKSCHFSETEISIKSQLGLLS